MILKGVLAVAAAAALCRAAAVPEPPLPVTQLVRQTDDPFKLPSYVSNKAETKVFEGCFVAVDPEEEVAIEVISDDGCDVTIDGVKALNFLRKPQHLKYPWESVKSIPAARYGAAPHHIKVEYSNLDGKSRHMDVDGCTLSAPGLRFFECGGHGVKVPK